MKKTLQILLAGILSAAMLLAMAGCTSTPPASSAPGTTGGASAGANEGYTINYMTTQSRLKDSMKAIAEKLKAEKGITVEFQVVPDAQFQNLLLTKINSGEVPDIIDVNCPEVFPIYNAAENFVDLSSQPFVSRLTNPDMYMYDGAIYGMPYQAPSSLLGVYYNQDIFTELGIEKPTTYQEILDAAVKVKEEATGVTPIFFSNKDVWTTQIGMVSMFASALDGEATSTYASLMSNQTAFADVPQFKEALTAFQALFTDEYANVNHVTATYDDAKEAIATGKAAMIVSGEFAATDIAAKWPDANLGFVPLMLNDVDKATTSNLSGGLVVMKNSPNVENAIDFVNLWSQPEYLEMFYAENPGLSAFSDVDGGTLAPVLQTGYTEYMNTGEVVYQMNDAFAPASAWLSDTLWPMYVQVAMGMDVDEAIIEIDSSFQDFCKTQGIEGF